MADRIVVLNAGNIEQVGSPLELYNTPGHLFVAGFIGSPEDELHHRRAGRQARRTHHRHPPRAHRHRRQTAAPGRAPSCSPSIWAPTPSCMSMRARPARLTVRAPGEYRGQARRQAVSSRSIPAASTASMPREGLCADATARQDRDHHRRRARHRRAPSPKAMRARARRVCDRRHRICGRAKRRRQRIGNGSFAFTLDVTDAWTRSRPAWPRPNARLGGIDILVNNAALFDMAPIGRDHRKPATTGVFAVNVKGSLFTLQAVAEVHDRARQGRQDHQHGLAGRPPRRGAGRRLLRHQGRRHLASPSRPAST